MTDRADALVVQDCLGGNHEAFGALVDRYQGTMFNVSLRIVRNVEDAADVTQTAFVKAFENLKSFNPRYKFFSWLFRIVVNESLNHLKRNRAYTELDEQLLSTDPAPDETYQREELRHRIDRALQDLKLEYRVVLILRHFQDLSYQDISYITDVPEKTVKSRLFTARKLLREKLMRRGVQLRG
jgi:RNA polymerase sigma-70 factor (ECF subfamily)